MKCHIMAKIIIKISTQNPEIISLNLWNKNNNYSKIYNLDLVIRKIYINSKNIKMFRVTLLSRDRKKLCATTSFTNLNLIFRIEKTF